MFDCFESESSMATASHQLPLAARQAVQLLNFLLLANLWPCCQSLQWLLRLEAASTAGLLQAHILPDPLPSSPQLAGAQCCSMQGALYCLPIPCSACPPC